MAHSLVRENMELLNDLAYGRVKAIVKVNNKTGESTSTLQMTLPPEEAFESFAARLRPFTMGKESVYWASVLDALEKLLSKETMAEVVDMESLREHWKRVVEGANVAQAYSVMTEKGQLTDAQLADLWLNSDALHTQPITSAIGKDLSLNERYRAAVGVFARIGAVANHTYFLITHLYWEGLLELDPSAFTIPVLADTSMEKEVKMYSAEVGAPLPTDLSDLDPEVWTPVHEDLALLGKDES
ncbi:hypothetical protein JYB55_26050 [Mycolicibacterium septicum]|nr:hypothetical protein [Mycolicibacterium septicum]